MANYPRQGDIREIDFDPVPGRKQGGLRPALVISKDGFNSSPSQLCVVAAITSRQRGWLAHINVSPPEGGLDLPSAVMCDQIRSVSHARFQRHRGRVSAETLRQVIRMVHRIVGET